MLNDLVEQMNEEEKHELFDLRMKARRYDNAMAAYGRYRLGELSESDIITALLNQKDTY